MKTTNEELEILIRHCGLGNKVALETLYKKLSPFLNNFAMGFVHCEALSNEVLQDSFIQIWKSSARYCEHRGKPLTWICMIVRSRAIDKLRTEKKHLRFSGSKKSTLDADQLPGERQPELEVAHAQSMLSFSRHLAELSLNEQICIKLAYLQDYSRKELAEMLDANVNTVKSWLRRGLKHLQRYDMADYPENYAKLP